MSKKVLLAIIAVIFLMTGCGRARLTSASQIKGQPPLASSASDSSIVTVTPEQAASTTVTPKPGYGLNNIKDIKGFVPFEDQSFMVNLDSWGNVKFVSGKLTAGSHIPTVFYLTDKDGNILYSFEDTPFPYSVDVKSVSFTDVNKDGLKDVIIIVTDVYEGANGNPIAAVWLQNADGTFTCDLKLYQEINASGNNKDIETVKDYLSKKF